MFLACEKEVTIGWCIIRERFSFVRLERDDVMKKIKRVVLLVAMGNAHLLGQDRTL